MLVAAALALAYLLLNPTGADMPAQLLRVRLFGEAPFGLWNNWWYGGVGVLGYSVLFPPLGWLLTPQLAGAAASVGTAAAFATLADDTLGEDAWLGATWLGAATVTELLSGRLTFALGLCGTALTALALERQHPSLAVGCALLATLASPVAGLFAALAGLTAVLACPGRRLHGIVVLGAALLPLAALVWLFPQAGSQPFAFSVLWPLLVAGVGIAALVGAAPLGGARTLRTLTPSTTRAIIAATLLYLAGLLLAYALTTPLGSNATRLGELVAGPLAALLLVPRRAYVWLALAALPLTYIQTRDAVSDLQHGWQAPYDSPAYYAPVVSFLKRAPGAAQRRWRVEVPFTQGHWEAYYLAKVVPLARGWERQADIADDQLFYAGKLGAARYHAWLRRLAVRYVAVADAPLDYSSRAEAKLIRGGLPYLHVVARVPHWTIYGVKGATPLASGAATVTRMSADALSLRAHHGGQTLIRVRFSPYWQLRGIPGCVAPAGRFTRITTHTGGTARLVMTFSPARARERSAHCN